MKTNRFLLFCPYCGASFREKSVGIGVFMKKCTCENCKKTIRIKRYFYLIKSIIAGVVIVVSDLLITRLVHARHPEYDPFTASKTITISMAAVFFLEDILTHLTLPKKSWWEEDEADADKPEDPARNDEGAQEK